MCDFRSLLLAFLCILRHVSVRSENNKHSEFHLFFISIQFTIVFPPCFAFYSSTFHIAPFESHTNFASRIFLYLFYSVSFVSSFLPYSCACKMHKIIGAIALLATRWMWQTFSTSYSNSLTRCVYIAVCQIHHRVAQISLFRFDFIDLIILMSSLWNAFYTCATWACGIDHVWNKPVRSVHMDFASIAHFPQFKFRVFRPVSSKLFCPIQYHGMVNNWDLIFMGTFSILKQHLNIPQRFRRVFFVLL